MKKIFLFFLCLLFSYVKPLIHITRTGDINLIRDCINSGNFDISEKDIYGHNSINWVSLVGRVDILNLFLDSFSIDDISEVIDEKDIVGNTPLMNALISRNFTAVLILLICGANPEIQNGFRQTPNQQAFLKGIINHGELLRMIMCKRFSY